MASFQLSALATADLATFPLDEFSHGAVKRAISDMMFPLCWHWFSGSYAESHTKYGIIADGDVTPSHKVWALEVHCG